MKNKLKNCSKMDDSLMEPPYENNVSSETHTSVTIVYNLMLRNGSVYSPDEISIETKDGDVYLRRENVSLKIHCGICVIEEPAIHSKLVYAIPIDSWVLSRKLDEIF